MRVLDRDTGEIVAVAGSFRDAGRALAVPRSDRLLRLTTRSSVDLLDLASEARVGEPFTFDVPPEAVVGGGSLSVAADGSYALIGIPNQPLLRLELDPVRWLATACRVAGRNLTRLEWDRYFGNSDAYHATCPEHPSER